MERTGSLHGGGDPRQHDLIRDLPLRDVDDSDRTFQFRLNEEAASLVQSMERDGQITPIQVIAGRATFRIIDGFRRTAAARELGWTTIRALVHPPMLPDEAKKIAFVANVVRRNLTVLEKANAIQMARQEGYSKADIAGMFGVSQRQIERYLALPEHLLAMIDGREVTMAHARILADHRVTMSGVELAALIDRVRRQRMSAPDLQRWLIENGQARSTLGAPSTLGNITRDSVRIHRLEVTRSASPQARAEMATFLKLVLRKLEEFGTPDGERADGVVEIEP